MGSTAAFRRFTFGAANRLHMKMEVGEGKVDSISSNLVCAINPADALSDPWWGLGCVPCGGVGGEG